MAQTTLQTIYQLLVFAVLIVLSVSRPQGNVDSQESPENQLSMADLGKVYTYIRSPQYLNYEEPNTSDRVHFLQYRPIYPSSPFRGDSGGAGANMPLWDPYRQLVSKRQTRYRQCYFNPISCFRK